MLCVGKAFGKLIAITKRHIMALHRSKISEEFEVKNEIHQGCILSRMPFVFAISDVIHAVVAEGRGGFQ